MASFDSETREGARAWLESGDKRGLSLKSIDELDTGTASGISNSVSAALTDGLTVAETFDGRMNIINPNNKANDATALQNLVDWVKNNAASDRGSNERGGSIWIPAHKPDGTNWNIGSTIVLGVDEDLISYIVNFVGFSRGTEMRSTMDDGSHMFRFQGDVTGGTPQKSCVFGAEPFSGTFRGNSNDTGIVEFRKSNEWFASFRSATDFTGDVITIDGICTEWVLGPSRIDPNDTQTTPTARVIHLTDSQGDGQGADGVISPGFTWGNAHDVGIEDDNGFQNLVFAGKCEGAEGTANIVMDAAQSRLFVASTARIRGGASSGSAHGVLFDGERLGVAGGAFFDSLNGSGVRITGNNATGTDVAKISHAAVFHNNSGADIRLDEDTRRGVIPHPSEIPTANYPSLPLSNYTFTGGSQPASYSLSNVSTDRTLDADSTTTAELADVLGTLIQDLNYDSL